MEISQNSFDSIVAPHKMFWENPYEYWHSPEKYGISSEKIKQLLDDNSHIQGLNSYYARKSHFKIFQEKQDRDSALFYANKSIESINLLKKDNLSKNDSVYLFLMYYQKANQERKVKKDYKNAIISLEKAFEIAKYNNYKPWFSICNFGIAKNHYLMENDSISLSYFKKVTLDSSHMSIPRPYISTYAHMGIISFRLHELRFSKEYTQKALKKSLSSDKQWNMYPLYSLMADIYEKEKNEDSLRYYYKKAIDRFENVEMNIPSNKKAWGISYLEYKAYFKIEEGNINEAINDLKNIIDDKLLLDKITAVDKKEFLRALAFLGKAYEKSGNSLMYSDYLESTISFLEKFEKFKLIESLDQLEVRYQTKEKEQSIKQFELNEEQQNEVILQQRIITVSIIGLFMLFIVIVYLLSRQLKLKNLNKRINLEQRLLQAQLNPHFIFNTLSEIQYTIEEDPKKAKQNIVKFSRLLASIFENSALNYVSLETEIETLQQYMDLQKIRLNKNFNYKFELNNIDSELVFIPTMLIQPIVENSIKHGFKDIDYTGELTISFKQETSFLECTIEDNGNGLVNTSKPSNRPSSMKLIKSYLEKIKGSNYSISETKDTKGNVLGIKVSYAIPYKSKPYD